MTEATKRPCWGRPAFRVRDLKVRQMDALKDWLRASPWAVREAACLIAGVLPPERMNDTSAFGGVLPGREAWQEERETWREMVAFEIAHLETLLKEQGVPKGATPQGFLALAAQLDRNPPWLDAARADAEARALLQSNALEGYAPIIVEKMQRSGRKVDAPRLVAGFIVWRLHQDNPDTKPADTERELAAVMRGSQYVPPEKRWIEDILPRYRRGETPRDVFAHNARTGENSQGMTVDFAEATAARLLDLHRKKMSRK